MIAIDGPAGSGKSSTARAVASRLGYLHLDSGAFYRAITLAALEEGIPAEEWATLSSAQLEALGVTSRRTENGYTLQIDGEEVGDRIRAPEVNAHVSRMAAVPTVRDWLLSALRAAGSSGGLVADGRDIGTIVFPDAELKIFLIADPAERARRRLREQGSADPSPQDVEAETARLIERDRQDEDRETAPLLQAHDAVLLDTTHLSLDQQVGRIVELAHQRM